MKAYPQLRQPTGNDTIPADARIITPGGRSIPAHCSILASASPVLEILLYRPTRRRWNPRDHKTIFIPGVPCEAIEAFLSLIYSPRCLKKETGKETMKMYGMHLLVLSHAYSIEWLKRAAELALPEQLTKEVVVDVLHLARQCDASQLYIRYRWVERLNRRRKKMWEQGLYLQLSEAMECLAHICTEGCIGVDPYDKETRKGPCASFKTCQSLQLLIRHFAICGRKKVASIKVVSELIKNKSQEPKQRSMP